MLSYSGNYTQDVLQEGEMNEKQALMYGLTMGGLETGLDTLGDKIKGKALGEGAKTSGLKESIKAGVKEIVLGGTIEGSGEALTEPLQELVKTVYGGTANFENMDKRMMGAFLAGFASDSLQVGASFGIGKAVGVMDKIQNGEKVSTDEIASALQEINQNEELDITKLLAQKYGFNSQDLYVNTDVQQNTNQKLENVAEDISRGEYRKIKINQLVDEADLNEETKQAVLDIAQKYNMSEEKTKSVIDYAKNTFVSENQQATMQNKEVLENGQQVISNKYELPQNQFSQVFEESAKKHQVDTNNDYVRQARIFTDRANLQLKFDTGFKKDTLAVYKNGEVIVNAEAIKNNPDKVLQNIVLHEALHGKSGSKEFNDVLKTVLKFAQRKGDYKGARLDLENIYREAYGGRPDFKALIDEEIVTNTLGEYFGTEEGLNELINYVDDRTTLQKIYDFVKDILNSLTGYKDQEQYFRRVERQLAKALQSDYVAKSGDRFSVQSKISNESNVNTKQKQLEIILKSNPMHDDYHTGIRSIEDIKTYQEALDDDLDGEIQDLTPDFKANDLRKALETGEVTVYSSYPIEQGVFVTPSKMEAGSYAGNINKVYSKKIKLSDVAWIDTLQGQYAKVEDTKVVKDNKGKTLSKEQSDFYKDISPEVLDSEGNLITVYHTTTNTGPQFNEFNPVGTPGYRFGKQVVNYYTDSKEMSGSYADQLYQSADTKKLTSTEEVRSLLDSLNDKYVKFELKENEDGSYTVKKKFNLEENSFYSNLDKDLLDLQKIDSETFEALLKRAKDASNGYSMFSGLPNDKVDNFLYDFNNRFGDYTAGATAERIKTYIIGDINKVDFSSEKDLYRNVKEKLQKQFPKQVSRHKYQYEGYTNLKNPFVIDAGGRNWNKVKSNPDSIYDKQDLNAINKTLDSIENISQKVLSDIEEIYNNKEHMRDFREKLSLYINSNKELSDTLYYYDELTGLDSIKTIETAIARDDLNRLSAILSNQFVKAVSNGKELSTNDIVHRVIEMNKNGANYDGVIIKNTVDYGGESKSSEPANVYVTFNSNQFKSYDNTTPTDDPDIRYSLSQDTRKNIESKIDRYSRIVEEMQQEGRDSDEWTPYANEILRLQDQLEESRYSYQTNGKWQEFVEKYFTSEGTKTKLGDIKLPQKVVKMKDFNDLLDRAINIPQADKKALKSELKGVNLTPESLKEFEQTVNDMDKAYKEINNEILNTNQNTTTRKATYNKYNKYNTEYDNSSLEKAKQVVPANKQGRRTKEQWLNVAKQIGTEIANKTNQEIEEIAYRTWQDEAPNQKSSLNRQGEKYVKFTSDEWINTIYNTVKEQREKLSIDTNKQLPQPRRIVDEVYKEEIAEGKTRKHYQSIFESDQIGETGKEVAKELYKKDTYVPISNLDTITKTNENIARMGVENAYIGFTNKIHSNERITLQDIAMGERLIQIYSENGDYDKVNELIQDVAILGTELGQQVQAMSLIKKASPEGQLQYLNKLLERVNIRENTDIKITKQQTEKILKSKGAKDLENNVSQVAIEIAKQIPLKLSDKIRAWRFLSMLGNPKTHIKNFGANAFMNLTQNLKNKVGGALEAIVNVFNPNMERTKTLRFSNKDQRQFAKQDADEMIGQLGAGGKYDIKNIIEQNKRQFDSKVLDAIAKFNSDLLESEDTLFLKIAYQQAMSNYMTANNLKSSDMQGEVLEKARQYATLQANEATFHEANAVASLINRLEQQNAVTDVVVSGILPFKKTPMNIAKAGFEYSPAGLIKTIGYDIGYAIHKTNDYKQQLAEGKISEQQYKTETSKMLNKTIDNMAKGLTGSSITAIGIYLAFKGILKAGNDDEGDEFEEKRGSQEYAITLGDHSYTLDWVSPTAIPLFVGATMYQLATSESEDKQTALNSMFTGLSKSFEPMTEMSMLQGLTSAITSYESGSSNMLFDLGASVVTSYAGQFLPTAMGQVARTIDPYERDTSTTKKGIEGKVDRFVRQSANKIPGVSKMLPTKSDVWGEEVKRDDNWLKRYTENAILPWSQKEITQDRTDKELLSVFDQTGEKTLPGVPSKDITLNSTKYRMTTEEYNQAKKDFGQTSKGIFDDLVTTREYQGLTPEGKAKAISDVYSYAKEKIKVDYAEEQGEKYKPTSLYNTVSELEKQKGDVSAYFEFKGKLDDLDRAKGDEKVKQKEKLEYLNSMKTTDKTKTIIYEDTFGADDEVFSNLQILTGNKISINDYLDYKTTNIEGVEDPNSNIKGKKIPGSGEKIFDNFMAQSTFSGIERLYLKGTKYTLDSAEKNTIIGYVNSLGVTEEEKYNIYKKLKNFQETKDGKYGLK